MESKQTTFVVIALIVVAFFAYWFFQSQEVTAPGTETNTASSTEVSTTDTQVNSGPTATLSVVTDKESYAVGEQVALTFYADSPVPVAGTDVTFSFDATKLEVEKGLTKENFAKEISQIATVNQAQKVTGAPAIQFVKTTKVGDKINYSFSALALPGQGFTGKTNLGTITLRAKKNGDTPVVISFEKAGLSTDSNVAYEGRDILGNVEGTIVHVKTSSQ